MPVTQSYPKTEVLPRYKMTLLSGLNDWVLTAPLTATGNLGSGASLG